MTNNKKISRKEIKEDLISQLQSMGVVGTHFYSLVDDYMNLWDIKQALKKDIKDRGVVVEWKNSETSRGYKKNDSIDAILKTTAQMQNILKSLKIETTDSFGDEDDDF